MAIKLNNNHYDAPDLVQMLMSGSVTVADILAAKPAQADLLKVLELHATAVAAERDKAHQADIAKVKADAAKGQTVSRGLTVKVNMLGSLGADGKTPAKGNIGVYGLGQYPVTLYAAQWVRLLEIGPAIVEAMRSAGMDKLSHKNPTDRPLVEAFIAAHTTATPVEPTPPQA